MTSPTSFSEWTCTICNRKMLPSQQQDHLAGKAHRAKCSKHISEAKAPSNPSLQPATAEDSSAIINISTTKTQKAKPKLAKSRTTRAKNTNTRDNKAVRIPSPQSVAPQLVETGAYPDWGFVGFQQSARTFAANYDATDYGFDNYHYSGKGHNFALCDKDCGWCGHCMDNVNV